MNRGAVWSERLIAESRQTPDYGATLRVVDGSIDAEPYRSIAVVPDPSARFPRARSGEVGLDEALAIADAVREAPTGSALIALVDLPGQAFGRREEAAGLHVMLAAAVDAYITERRRGRPTFSLIVGRAISGGFLTHGMQAGWIGALDDAGLEVHVMAASSVARVTRSKPAEIARIATVVPATARDIGTFAEFGAVDRLFSVLDPLDPSEAELLCVRSALSEARAFGYGLRSPRERLAYGDPLGRRAVAREVRNRIGDAW